VGVGFGCLSFCMDYGHHQCLFLKNWMQRNSSSSNAPSNNKISCSNAGGSVGGVEGARVRVFPFN